MDYEAQVKLQDGWTSSGVITVPQANAEAAANTIHRLHNRRYNRIRVRAAGGKWESFTFAKKRLAVKVKKKPSVYHPISEQCFGFEDKYQGQGADMGPILRLFLANEYDRDPSILERLKVYLSEYGECIEAQPIRKRKMKPKK